MLAGMLGAAPAIAHSEAVERLWRVRWLDPNGSPSERTLEVQRVGQAELEAALYQRVQRLDDGTEYGVGWVRPTGASPSTAPEVRGRLTGGEGLPSALSAPLVLEGSVLAVREVPEPNRGLLLGSGLVALAIASRRRGRRLRKPTSSLPRASG